MKSWIKKQTIWYNDDVKAKHVNLKSLFFLKAQKTHEVFLRVLASFKICEKFSLKEIIFLTTWWKFHYEMNTRAVAACLIVWMCVLLFFNLSALLSLPFELYGS